MNFLRFTIQRWLRIFWYRFFCKLVGHKLIEVAAAFDHVTGDTKSD